MAELGILLIGAAVVALVAVLIPTLIELRKTMTEAKELLALVRTETLPLLREVREVGENVNVIAEQVRVGGEYATNFLRAVGNLGTSIQHAQDIVRGKSSNVVSNIMVLGAGIRAATDVVMRRVRKERSPFNGR